MVRRDELASAVYERGLKKLDNGIHPDLLRANPELRLMQAGYWTVQKFLRDRGAMLVGDMAEPNIVVKHLETEQGEAKEVLGDYPKLRLEIGDVNFLGLVIGGLLWAYLDRPEKKRVQEILLWSGGIARVEGIDADKAVVWAAEKNDPHYPKHELQLMPGEKVGEVVGRLPTVYEKLREQRKRGLIDAEVAHSTGYSHAGASRDDSQRWGRYDS